MITEHLLFMFPIYGDVSKIHFGKYGIRLSRIDSPRIAGLLTQPVHTRLENQLSYLINLGLEEHCYVFTEKGRIQNLWKLYYFLRVIKPTNVNPVAELQVSFTKKNGKKSVLQIPSSSTYPLDVDKFLDRPLIIPDAQTGTINKMLNNYMAPGINPFFKKLESIYHQALSAEKPYMKFLTLMMVIEALIIDNETQMVTYKIRRLCAVLLAKDKDAGQLIFDNLGKLYAVRSKIVHSADDKKLTQVMINYLHCIVSEILNTILITNCDPKTLHQLASRFGYGDRADILRVLGKKSEKRFTDNYVVIIRKL